MRVRRLPLEHAAVLSEANLLIGERFHLFKAAPELRKRLNEVKLTPGLAAWEAKMAIIAEAQKAAERT